MAEQKFLPPVKSIQKGDIPGAPAWIDPLLDILNRELGYLYIAFDGGLTLGGNIRGMTKEVDFRTQSDYTSGEFDVLKFSAAPLAQVTAVELLQIRDLDALSSALAGPHKITSWFADGSEVNVLFIPGLEASRRYRMRVHIW